MNIILTKSAGKMQALQLGGLQMRGALKMKKKKYHRKAIL